MTSRFSIIFSFILATLLAVGGVELFYRTVAEKLQATEKTEQTVVTEDGKPAAAEKTKKAAPAVTKKTSKQAQKSGRDYSLIVKRELFGTPKKEAKQAPKAEPVLNTTTLDLILLGTISGEGDTQRAIILDKKAKSQDIYYNGDAIGPALIKQVERGKVILTIDGKDEVLLMLEPKSIKTKGGGKNEAATLADLMAKHINIPEDELEAKKTPPISRKSSSRKMTFKRPKKQENDK